MTSYPIERLSRPHAAAARRFVEFRHWGEDNDLRRHWRATDIDGIETTRIYGSRDSVMPIRDCGAARAGIDGRG
jgi:hypothetical protein